MLMCHVLLCRVMILAAMQWNCMALDAVMHSFTNW